MSSSVKLVELLRGYREEDKDKGYAIIQSAQIQNIIARELIKYMDQDQEELEHVSEILILKLLDEIKLTEDINDGRVISFINKVYPLRLTDNLEDKKDTVSLDELMPGTNIPIKDTLISDMPEPEELVLKAERKEELMAAMKLLTPNQLRVVTLYFYERYTLEEIADEMNISHQAVSRTKERALATLKGVMGGQR